MEAQTEWLVLTYTLGIVLIIFIILWAIEVNRTESPNVCFTAFGVIPGFDANQINSCGTSRTEQCVFLRGSLSACETECNLLPDICKAFVFNQSSSTMKIINPSGPTFPSLSSNLFIRQ